MVFDKDVGQYIAPNRVVQHRFYNRGKIEYACSYRYDRFSRRNTRSRGDRFDRFLAFLGSSTVSGHGVDDDEAWVQLVANSLKNTKVYNYGVSGAGPQWFPGLVDRVYRRGEINEQAGYFVYQFVSGHLFRLDANLISTGWINRHLFYDYDENGELVNLGPIGTVQAVRIRLLETLKKSFLASLLFKKIDTEVWLNKPAT